MKKQLYPYLPYVWYSLALLPLFVLGSLFQKYAINVPHWDDHALKAFILFWEESGSLWQNLKKLFSQHNEHRIVFTRLVTFFIYIFKGTIDYKSMMIVGNLTLLGTYFVWFKSTIGLSDIRTILLAIGSLLLFTFGLYENFYWGMASLQNFGVIFFAFLSFFLFSFQKVSLPAKEPTRDIYFILALFFAFTAVFTSGNGLIVPIIGMLILLFQQRFRHLAIAAGVAFVIFFFYWLTFESRTDLNQSIPDKSLRDILYRTLLLSGSLTDTLEIFPQIRNGMSILVGTIALLIAVFFCLRLPYQALLQKYKPIPPAYLLLAAMALFVIGTILGTVLARFAYDSSILFTSKYKIYSNLLVLISGTMLLHLLPIQFREKTAFTLVAMAVLTYVNSYIADKRFHLYTYQDRMVELGNLSRDKNATTISPLLQRIYKRPNLWINQRLHFGNAPVYSQWIDSVQINPETVQYFEFGDSLYSTPEGQFDAAFLVLRSDSILRFFPMYRAVHPNPVKRIFSHWSSSLSAEVSRVNFPSGIYEAYVLLKDGHEETLLNTQKTIRIMGIRKPEEYATKNW